MQVKVIPPDKKEVKNTEKAEELSGKLGTSDVEDKLMRSVLESDEDKIDDGKLLSESINQSMGSFTPDMMFENLVERYKMTKNIVGEKMIRQLTGYEPDFVERNRNIPEFQEEIKKNISSKIKKLKKDGLIDKEGSITNKGYELSSIVVYLEEMDKIKSHGFLGEKTNKKKHHYGERGDLVNFKKGDRYKDINIRASIKLASRRGHQRITASDLKIDERKSKGKIELIYALDASASMKGRKIEMAKKAGIALAFKAIEERNKVGIIVFGDEVKEEIMPTSDFGMLLQRIHRVRATNQTNISTTLARASEMFKNNDATKHLMLITDALPTEGEDPEEETLEACAKANSAGITISLIGINLNASGKKLARKITEIGGGRLHIAKDIEKLDLLVLQDYMQE